MRPRTRLPPGVDRRLDCIAPLRPHAPHSVLGCHPSSVPSPRPRRGRRLLWLPSSRMSDRSVQGDELDPTLTLVSASLVKLLLDRLAAPDGRIHAEDAISAAACVVAERCISAAGELDPSNHQLAPGSRVFSERLNELISGNQPTVDSAHSASVVGVLRDRLVAVGYRRDEFPDLKRVFEEFAARIGNADEWGWAPLSVPTDNRPHLMPLMVAFETRADV